MDMKQAEAHSIMEISHHKDNVPVSVTTDMRSLFSQALEQNFVPVVDDRNTFIGIVTRKSIMQYYLDTVVHQPQSV